MLILLAEVQINFHISLYIQTFSQVFNPPCAQTAVTATGGLHFTQQSACTEYQSE